SRDLLLGRLAMPT
ncbi:hypothetical protein EE612_037113, partial [Oryza sativa]